jgi:alpha-1,2-glucosyltransferase
MFLFYTETASLISILMLYYGVTFAKLPGIINLLFGIISLAMRQTNIIWANYTVLVILIGETSTKSKNSADIFIDCKEFFIETLRKLPEVLKNHWWLVILDLLFIGFLRWNNYSIVLGHHDHHSFSIHLMQLCYLSLFMILFPMLHSLSDMIFQFSSIFTSVANTCLYLCLTGICFFLTRSFTVLHPFLDADNRHYA